MSKRIVVQDRSPSPDAGASAKSDPERSGAKAGSTAASFRRLADSLPQIVWMADVEGRTEYLNRRWSIHTGAEFEPGSAEPIAGACIHPEDVERASDAWAEALRDELPFQVEHRIRSAAGEYRWFQLSAQPERDPRTGEIERWYGTATEIHARKEAELALEESRAQQQFLLDLTERLGPLDDVVEIERAATSALSERLSADRVSILTVADERSDGDVEVRISEPHRSLASPAGEPVGAAVHAELLAGHTVLVEDVTASDLVTESERDAHRALGSLALVRVPILRDGRLRAVVSVHFCDPHAFSRAEVSLIESVAAQTWGAVERAHSAEALRASERRVRTMADTSPAILWVTDRSNRCIYLSRQWRAFTGQGEADSLGFGWVDAVHPEDRDRASRHFLSAARKQVPFSFDCRFQTPDGEYRWALDEGRPWYDEEGRWNGYVGTVIDIHDRVLATQALRASEARYRALFESIDEGFFITQVIFDDEDQAVDLRYLEMNPAFERQSGMENAVGRTLREMVPDIEEFWLEAYGRVARTGDSIRFVNRAMALNRWFDVFAFPTGEPDQVAVIFTDITARKGSEEALKTERGKLATVIANLPVGVGVGDAEGRILSMNRAGRAVHGFASEAEVTSSVEEYSALFELRHLDGSPLPVEQWPMTRAMRGEFVRSFELRLLNRSTGAERVVSYDVVPVQDAKGALDLLVYVMQDLTERKKAEEALLTAMREAAAGNQAKSDFLAAMSHELRTPLNAIGGYVELLEMGIHGPVTENQSGALGRITANQRHLLALINDILSFARLEAGRMEFEIQPLSAMSVLASVESLISPQAETKGIAYTVESCEAGLQFLGDAERVRQILLNLVGNAIKFTPEGGWVILSCEREPGSTLLRVRDNGPGIPASAHERIFDPFHQVGRRLDRPQEGVGLGLAISRDLARALGGDVTVQSEPGEGSVFTLRLPAVE